VVVAIGTALVVSRHAAAAEGLKSCSPDSVVTITRSIREGKAASRHLPYIVGSLLVGAGLAVGTWLAWEIHLDRDDELKSRRMGGRCESK
jgi:hypothetical protein